MAFIDCIQQKADAGLLTKKQVADLEARFNDLSARYKKSMSDTDAAAKAAADVVTTEAARISDKKRNDINGALAQLEINKRLEAEAKNRGITYDEAARNLLESAYVRRQVIFKQHLSNIDKFVGEFRSKFAGFRRRLNGIDNVVAEMLGKNTGDSEARQLGMAIRKVFDGAHKRFKDAGGIIGRLDNYFPQSHKYDLIKKVSFEEWYNYLRPRLDTNKMINPETRLPFSDKELLAVIKEDYQRIITKGKSELQKRAAEGKQGFGARLEISSRKQASRFYHFKSPDAFLEYNEKFGVGQRGLFDAVINHLEGFARDTAILETLGPKPNAVMRHLDLQFAARDVSVVKRKWTQGMYDVMTGFIDTEVGEPAWFRVIGNARNIFSAAFLGSAPLSAVADTAFLAASAHLRGASATKALFRYVKLLNPLSRSHRKLAEQAGYIAEVANGSALGDVRFTGEALSGEWTAWASQFTNRASGLHAMTKAAADAVSLEVEGNLGRLIDQNSTWNMIDKPFREALEAHGITKADWEIMRGAELTEPKKGIKFLRSADVAVAKNVDPKLALEVANKLDDFIQGARNIATNEPTLRTKAITTGAVLGDARRGTALRALFSSTLQFTSFPITVVMNHIIPSMRAASPIFRGDFKNAKFAHAGYTFVGATLMGAVGVQLAEIAKGRDAKDMSDHKFWIAAMLKGGGMSLFADFLFHDYTTTGRSLAEQAAGPTIGFISDFSRVFGGNLNRIIEDDTGRYWEKFRRDLFLLAKRNVPGVNLWYSRLAVERFLLDNIEKAVDPQFDRRHRLFERRLMKETGQEFFWAKGEASPRRGPRQAERR